MRFVYMDEAGISSSEPVTVVAGVVVDGDQQFRLLESFLKGMADAYAPEGKRSGFTFHAKELANGGKVIVRGHYDDARRLQALRKMAGIPRRFLLPIVIGWHRKDSVADKAPLSPHKKAVMSHATAYMQCALAADQFMKRFAKPDEVALCVAENNDSARKAVKSAHRFLNEMPARLSFMNDGAPLSRIVDTVHFAEKSEAALLQIADVVAYVVTRYINCLQGSDLLMDIMTGGRSIPRENFAAGAGYRVLALYLDDAVLNQRAWFASNLVRSTTPMEGFKSVDRAGKSG